MYYKVKCSYTYPTFGLGFKTEKVCLTKPLLQSLRKVKWEKTPHLWVGNFPKTLPLSKIEIFISFYQAGYLLKNQIDSILTIQCAEKDAFLPILIFHQYYKLLYNFFVIVSTVEPRTSFSDLRLSPEEWTRNPQAQLWNHQLSAWPSQSSQRCWPQIN